MSLKTIALNSITAVLLTSSCTQSSDNSTSSASPSDELNPPVGITVATQGILCESIREGFERSTFAEVAAIGDCLEQSAINGGRALWIEFSELISNNPNITEADMKKINVSFAVSIASYGFRVTGISPTDFEQLYFAFRDAKGTNFEISPADMQRFIPTEDISAEEWDKLIESEVAKLLPKITIMGSP